MTRQSILVLGLVVVMTGGTGGYLHHIRAHQRLSPPGVRLVPKPVYDTQGKLVCSNTVDLPERVLNYSSQTQPIDPVVLSWLPKDTTYGQRVYQAPDGFQVHLAVVLMGTDRTSIHKPQYCLPAQGWTIEKTEATSIPVAQPFPYILPVMKLTAVQEARLAGGGTALRRGLNVYWFVSEKRLASRHEEWMWSLTKHLLLTGELERWAYVTCFAGCAPGQEETAYERMKELIRAAVPQFQVAAGERTNTTLSSKD